MIIKSFYRKKTTKVYLFIFVIIMLSLLLIKGVINNLDNQSTNYYKNRGLIVVIGDSECISILQSQKELSSINQALLFSYNDDLIASNYILDYELQNNVLVYSAPNLSNNELIINLRESDYEQINNMKDDMLGKEIVFTMNDNITNYVLKDIKKSKFTTSITISSEYFGRLLNLSEKFVYTAYAKDSDSSDKLSRELRQLIPGRIINSYDLTETKLGELQEQETILNYIKYLNVANYIVTVLFILIVIIINKNIVGDLKDDVSLEIKLGFTTYNIKKYIFARLCFLHLTSCILSILIYLLLIFITHFFFHFSLKLILNHIIVLWTLIMVLDFLLAICNNKKS